MVANVSPCLDVCLAVMMLFATSVVVFKDAKFVIASKFVEIDFNAWEIVIVETVTVMDATAMDVIVMDAILEDATVIWATVIAE
jgi:hypothetical protein